MKSSDVGLTKSRYPNRPMKGYLNVWRHSFAERSLQCPLRCRKLPREVSHGVTLRMIYLSGFLEFRMIEKRADVDSPLMRKDMA
jgi:hypothetical protein